MKVVVAILIGCLAVAPLHAQDDIARLRKAAEAGDPSAQVELARRYLIGRGVPRDQKQATAWYLKAAQQGNDHAAVMISSRYETGRGVEKNPAEALQWLQRAADRGSAEAERVLGEHYANGLLVPRDPVRAVEWYHKAAVQNDTPAQVALADAYRTGVGTPQDDAEAGKWYRIAADFGNASAQSEMGWRAEQQHDYKTAVGWYLNGATGYDVDAMYNVANAYDNGWVTLPGPSEAVQWFRKAADIFSDRDSLYRLGVHYQNGDGLPADPAQAVICYRDAADRGNADAQLALGRAYENGAGVPADPAAASTWLQKAAANGKPEAKEEVDFISWQKTGSPTYSATIHLEYDGQPFVPLTAPDVTLSSSRIGGIDPKQIAWKGDAVTISGIPAGHFGFTIAMKQSAAANHTAGSMYCDTEFDIAGSNAVADCKALLVMHVRKPIDNATVSHEKAGCPPAPLAITEVVWDPIVIPMGVTYRYGVGREVCGGAGTLLTSGETQSTSLPLRLPPSAPGEYYSVTLRAYSPSGEPIGIGMVAGENWFGRSITFTVLQPASN